MSPKRAALRLLRRLPEDGLLLDSDRLLVEAWLWRQAGDRRRERETFRARAELLAARQERLLARLGRSKAGL